MHEKISYGVAWLARGAAALAGLCLMVAMVLVGVLVTLAVVVGMFALPWREHSKTRRSGNPANSGHCRPRPLP